MPHYVIKKLKLIQLKCIECLEIKTQELQVLKLKESSLRNNKIEPYLNMFTYQE